MPAFRIVSINTGKGDGAYRRRIELLGSGLSALQPDLVLLQESLKSADGNLDTTQQLADRLAMHPSYVPARFKGREVEGAWHDTWSGMGLLSRSVPDAVVPVVLPQDERDGDRIALVARFGDLAIANLHLTHLRGEDASLLRRKQIETLLSSEMLLTAKRVLIGGDFNTPLAGIRDLLSSIGDWTAIDAFGDQLIDRATVPVTRPMSEGYCIDFIFALIRDGEPIPAFIDSRVVLGEADEGGVYPSDHRGIMTTVTYDHDLEHAQ